MTPTKPYLTRAFYEWIVDNDCTPYLLVDATVDQVVIPRQFVENDKIILNVSPTAVHGLSLGNEFIAFSARFSGKSQEIFVPLAALLAIYAKETGQGMVFNDLGPNPPSDSPPDMGAGGATPPSPPAAKRPGLKVVK